MAGASGENNQLPFTGSSGVAGWVLFRTRLRTASCSRGEAVYLRLSERNAGSFDRDFWTRKPARACDTERVGTYFLAAEPASTAYRAGRHNPARGDSLQCGMF